MPKRHPLPSSRHHVIIYDEDWDFLTRCYGKPDGQNPIGIGEAIRAIVHAKVVGLKARAREEYDRREQLEAAAVRDQQQ